jgi:cardiolipin synthase
MSTQVSLPLWAVILAGGVFLLLVLIIWSVKRRRRPHLGLEPHDNEDLIPSIAGVTQGTIVEGNRIELVHNGEFFDWLFRDLERAEKTITFETFLCKEGQLTQRLTHMLLHKRTQDVEVRMTLDGSGGRHFGDLDLKRLENAGVKIAHYHPVKLRNLGLWNNRDHRKIIVIDGRVGYVGGHCFVDSWLGNAQDDKHWRDISARVEGPLVSQLQSAFAENWIEETGEVIGGTNFFPRLEPAGETPAHAVWVSATGSPSAVKILHYMAIHAAKKRVWIQNPYFLPDPDARASLLDAVKRGVDVRVMIPSAKVTDSPVVQHASHHHYGTLLKGGVKLFDYKRTLLHQKVMTIDGEWACLGSTNFDDRSFELNDEISIVVYDERIARELEEIFEADLKHAVAVDLEHWKKRPWGHKLLDFSAFVFNEQL